jgi:hypothetical protein
LLFEELLLRGRGVVARRAAGLHVGQLSKLSGAEAHGEEVVVPFEEDPLAAGGKPGVGFAGRRVGQAGLLVGGPVVEVQVAVGGVHLPGKVVGVDVLAVVPAVKRRRI